MPKKKPHKSTKKPGQLGLKLKGRGSVHVKAHTRRKPRKHR